jgi:hypothetical protein
MSWGEVTPRARRIRKMYLKENDRKRLERQARVASGRAVGSPRLLWGAGRKREASKSFCSVANAQHCLADGENLAVQRQGAGELGAVLVDHRQVAGRHRVLGMVAPE